VTRPDVEILARELRAAFWADNPPGPGGPLWDEWHRLGDVNRACWLAVARRALELLPAAASEASS
jgi:hypothetical protein